MKDINVRNLLIESRLSESFDDTYTRFKEVGKKFGSLAESSSTVKTLVEGTNIPTDETTRQLKESSKEFAKARKLLSNARDESSYAKRNQAISEAASILSLLESNIKDIEEMLHISVDLLESEGKKKV